MCKQCDVSRRWASACKNCLLFGFFVVMKPFGRFWLKARRKLLALNTYILAVSKWFYEQREKKIYILWKWMWFPALKYNCIHKSYFKLSSMRCVCGPDPEMSFRPLCWSTGIFFQKYSEANLRITEIHCYKWD